MLDDLVGHILEGSQRRPGTVRLHAKRHGTGRYVGIAYAKDGDVAVNLSPAAHGSTARDRRGERKTAGQQGVGCRGGEQFGIGSRVEVLAVIELVDGTAAERYYRDSPVRLAYSGISKNAGHRLRQGYLVRSFVRSRRKEKAAKQQQAEIRGARLHVSSRSVPH